MHVILFGATGMIGSGVLIECLDDPRVTSVLAVGRSPCGHTHPKLREIIRDDFFDYSDMTERLRGLDACFFCLGVSSVGMSEDAYRRLTLDLPVAVGSALEAASPGMTFCFISGQGADTTEQGRVMWARVKGAAENRLLEMNLDTYVFRPGYVQPMKGVRSKTALYQTLYTVVAPLYPLFRHLFGGRITTTVNIGRAMIRLAETGADRRLLGNAEINETAAAG